MSNLGYKPYTERHRPHFNPPGAIIFITCRLFGSIPKQLVMDYKRKNTWLEAELKRAKEAVDSHPSSDIDDWVSRIEL